MWWKTQLGTYLLYTSSKLCITTKYLPWLRSKGVWSPTFCHTDSTYPIMQSSTCIFLVSHTHFSSVLMFVYCVSLLMLFVSVCHHVTAEDGTAAEGLTATLTVVVLTSNYRCYFGLPLIPTQNWGTCFVRHMHAIIQFESKLQLHHTRS